MKKIVYMVFAFSAAIGQRPSTNLPLSWKINLPPPVFYTLPYLDSDSLESSINIPSSRRHYWGYPRKINISYRENKGHYVAIDDGDSVLVWRMGIHSPGAYFLYLILDSIWLPCSGTLYVYTASKQVLYQISCEDNRPYKRLTVGPIKGDKAILEYNVPKKERRRAIVRTSTVIHGFSKKKAMGFGASGPCHPNVMCYHPSWYNERRAVVLIEIIDPNFLSWTCTGVLLNNERRDGRPYVLTAFHCMDADDDGSLSSAEKNSALNWGFIFNYQSPTCANPTNDPGYSYIISGAYFRAANVNSDFALLELSKRPPAHFNVFYAGWNNDEFKGKPKPSLCVGIHHPKGDIKKIAIGSSAIQKGITPYDWSLPTLLVKVWYIQWGIGAMENGSSGSPLFCFSDVIKEGLVVGQLFGGGSKCSGVTLSDQYGRLDISWDDGSSPDTRLRDWLSPHSTSSMYIAAMSGMDPCKDFYDFTNASDLHTSANVNGLLLNPLVGQRSYDGVYWARNFIKASNNVVILPNTKVAFYAKEITLEDGFTAEEGSDFLADPTPCVGGCYSGIAKTYSDQPAAVVIYNVAVSPKNPTMNQDNRNENETFIIYPNPVTKWLFITIPPKYRSVPLKIELLDVYGRVIVKTYSVEKDTLKICVQGIERGIYLLKIHNRLSHTIV